MDAVNAVINALGAYLILKIFRDAFTSHYCLESFVFHKSLLSSPLGAFIGDGQIIELECLL